MKDSKGKKGAIVKKDTKKELKKVEDKEIRKRKVAVTKEPAKAKKRVKKIAKKKKDPNQPKRPQSAFFIFLDEFRKSFKEDHPEVKGVTQVVKAGGEKWKEMSESEKVPYHTKAAQRKSEYEKSLAAYKQKQDEEAGDEGTPEESDKSKSEINDEEESGEEEDDDQDD
eukprot:TRINITY_DN8866_c0_g1_i1.p1 TRINITY_DN8866_c0_g1~~TRINITY_DN8866_c0_g1_i1.p1  ORF type:complete len:168 (-),score=64.57 TRINITY_DN8866_c0_g1_i1:713-1216(-)